MRLLRDECKSVIKFESRLLLVDIAPGPGEPAGRGGSCRAGTGAGAPLAPQPPWSSRGDRDVLLSSGALSSRGLRWVHLSYFLHLAASQCLSSQRLWCWRCGAAWQHGERRAAGLAPLGRDRNGFCEEEKPLLTGAGRGAGATPVGIAASLLGRCLTKV